MVIRYRGKIQSDAVVKPMLKFVRDFAKNQGWKIMEWQDEGAMFAQKTTSESGFQRTLGKVEQEGVILNIDDALFLPMVIEKPMGALIWFFPAEGIEGDAWLATDQCFVITDGVPTEIHVAICELLGEIKARFIPSLQVLDEGEYFDSRNRKRLEILRRAEKYRSGPPAAVAELQQIFQEVAGLENPFAKTKSPN